MRSELGGAVLLVLLGCAHGSTLTGDPASTFDLAISGEGRGVTATCDAAGCSGPDVQVVVDAQSARGLLGHDAVDLALSEQAITGTIGTQPVSLRVDGEHLSGTFAGNLGDLRVGSAHLEGRIGRCSYDLHAKVPGEYVGNRSCGGSPTPTRLHVPERLLLRPPVERLALMALLLST